MELFLKKTKIIIQSLLSDKVLANLAMLITVTLWGMSFISIKTAVKEVPPITLALLRFMIASAILLTITKKIQPNVKLQRCDWGKMTIAGFFGITLYFYLENTGISLTTASSAALITAIIPILAIALDVLVFKTKIPLIQSLGIIGAMSGAYLAITANGQLDFSSQTFKGNLCIVGAMLSWSLYTLLNKSLNGKYSGLFLTTYQTLFGTIFLIPLSLFEYSQWHFFSWNALSNIFYLAICCSALGYFLYIYALSKLDVTITTLYLNLMSIIGVLSGHFFLAETIFPTQILGGIMILISIIIINFANSPTKKLAYENS
ncbi:DMT family transporter [Pelosinus sp. sgz500959]|uniref:DMT family transporter n=1 Tax=Pelosinus sp. sgz500959 TaxID=3242472 RepID=UPI00366AD752